MYKARLIKVIPLRDDELGLVGLADVSLGMSDGSGGDIVIPACPITRDDSGTIRVEITVEFVHRFERAATVAAIQSIGSLANA